MEFLDHLWLYPPGSIMPYIGTSDPDGWIICNGVLRTSTDSRYAALSVLLGGNANSITPPDLRSRFLRGNSTVSTISNGGSDSVTLTTVNIPSHSHGITMNGGSHTHNNTCSASAHNHAITVTETPHKHNDALVDPGHSHRCLLGRLNDGNWTSGNGEYPPGDGQTLVGRVWYTRQAGIVIYPNANGNATANWIGSSANTVNTLRMTNVAATTGITATCAPVGSGTSFSIIPPYATVNYIIKY
jgi:microcystin-dependent protein